MLLTLSACARAPEIHRPAAPRDLSAAEVDSLSRMRDYFTLRDRVAAAADSTSAMMRRARAILAHAFNQPEQSNLQAVGALQHRDLSDFARFRLRQMMLMNNLRIGQYAAGAALADSLAGEAGQGASRDDIRDIENMGRIMRAVADVPPQRVTRHGAVRTTLRQGRIPIVINDSARNYIFDTGANLSTIMSSEAAAVGLSIRQAGIRVGTSTDAIVIADMGVAERIVIGGMEFRNVIFLVMPDSLLTFGDMRIDGIIGFPVIAPMGEVRLRPRGELEVPAEVPARVQRNLALSGLTPLSIGYWRNNRILCRIDTGANTTDFYVPFFGRFQSALEGEGQAEDRKMGGAGGSRTLPVYRLSNVVLQIGDTTVRLTNADVLTRSIVEDPNDEYLDCNIGHDVFDQFSEYVFNFRDMAFLLR